MIARLPLAVALACAIAWPAVAEAKFEPPKLDGHFVDTTGTVSSALRTSIDHRLDTFRTKTSYAIVVFVAGSLQGESIEDVAYQTFNTWGIGTKGKDNGVLLLIAPTERKIRIETGKGAGGAITDLQASDIIAKMGPAMKAYRLDEAIDVACTELERLIMKDPGIAPAAPSEPKKTTGGVVRWIILGVFALCGLVLAVSRKARAFAKTFTASSGDDKPQTTRQKSNTANTANTAYSSSSSNTSSDSSTSSSDSSSTYSGPSNYTGGGGTSGGGGASGGY